MGQPRWRSLRNQTGALCAQTLVASLTAARKWEPPRVCHLTSGDQNAGCPQDGLCDRMKYLEVAQHAWASGVSR